MPTLVSRHGQYKGLRLERDPCSFEHRYSGCHQRSYNSHDTLDKDRDVQEEVRNVARSVVHAVKELRAGRLSQPDKQVKWPRTK
jgi:hypothetical protein